MNRCTMATSHLGLNQNLLQNSRRLLVSSVWLAWRGFRLDGRALPEVLVSRRADLEQARLMLGRARLELERAELLIRGGKYAEARAACARAMKAAHFTFVDLIKVRASCIEAESWLAAGQADKARPPAEQAVALADASGCPRALATALVTRGAVSLVHMDLSQAGADFNRAISVSPAEDVGLTALARAWTGGVLMVGGHPESAHALLGRAITAGAGVSLELAVLMHAWNARTLMVMEKPDGAEQSLRAAREALGQVRDALLPSIRMVFEEAEVVVGKTGVFRRSSSASKPKALR